MIFHGEDDGNIVDASSALLHARFLVFVPPCVHLGVFRLVFPTLRVFASSFSLAASHTHTHKIVDAGDSVPGP